MKVVISAGGTGGHIYPAIAIINKIKEESGLKNAVVVATGGLGKLIADHTESIDVYDSMLTMEGLRLIYEKTSGKKV